MTLREFVAAMRARGYDVKVEYLPKPMGTHRKHAMESYERIFGFPYKSFVSRHGMSIVPLNEPPEIDLESLKKRFMELLANEDIGFTKRYINHWNGSPDITPHCMVANTLGVVRDSMRCHKHKCEQCGLVWVHDNRLGNLCRSDWIYYHTCVCGKVAGPSHSGPEEIDFSHFPLPPESELE